MRVLMIVKANADSEAGIMPTTEQVEEMGVFNNELIAAGVMVDGAGLHPSSKGARLGFKNGKRVGSSRVDLQACKLEYSIVSPK